MSEANHGNVNTVSAGIFAFAPTGQAALNASAVTVTTNSPGVESLAAGTSIHHCVLYTTSSNATRVCGFSLRASARVLMIRIFPEAI